MKSTTFPWFVFFTIFFLFLSSGYVAGQQVIVNSDDWRDVYTGMLYARLSGEDGNFVINTQQGSELVQRIGGDPDVLLINGRTQVMPNLRALLQSRGYEVEEFRSRDAIETNQELAERLQPTKLIVVDDAYGYNAVSVATYAGVTEAYVLFADASLSLLIDDLQPEDILLYGHIPSAIFDELDQYSPRIINEQDRFEDNFELAKAFKEESNPLGLILTNGEFLEKQFFTDDVPILFTGRQNVPEEVIEFIRTGGFRAGTMIGNSLAPNARYIKDEAGISVFIKFAQGRNQQQIALDLFYLPSYNPLLRVAEATYDPSKQSLIVTYENPGEIATFMQAALTYGGQTVEDEQSIFLDAGTYKTITYPVSGSGSELAYSVLYGASPTALELILQGSIAVEQVTIDDRSDIALVEARYDPSQGGFFVVVENLADVDTYVLLEAVDVRVGGDRLRIGAEVVRIPAAGSKEIFLAAELTERDIERNRELELEAFYGERELSLVLFTRATLPFTVASDNTMLLFIAVGVVVLLILVLWFILFKRRKKKKPAHAHHYHHATHHYHRR